MALFDEDPTFSKYPETVTFTGVGNISLLQIHLIAASVVILGIIFAILAPPGGYIALAFFILLAAGYDMVFLRKSQKPVSVTLYLRKNPVEASYGENKLGSIKSGTIETDMDTPLELGFRPAPNKKLNVWKFETEEEARFTAKRLLEYLPRDRN